MQPTRMKSLHVDCVWHGIARRDNNGSVVDHLSNSIYPPLHHWKNEHVRPGVLWRAGG